jgi:hypothetical protein
MNAYEYERAECAADEEARADRRFRAWRRRQIIQSLTADNDPLLAGNRIRRARDERHQVTRGRCTSRLTVCNA